MQVAYVCYKLCILEIYIFCVRTCLRVICVYKYEMEEKTPVRARAFWRHALR